MHKLQQSATRKGAASFYVVIFAALVLSVIVISFIRLMVSEVSQNMSNDLSQSAYDSALAGVEDAKTAISMCQKNPNQSFCNQLYANSDCDSVAKVVYGGATEISSTNDQAYTCVMLNKELNEYLDNLSASTPVKVIPIDGNTKKVNISWFSDQDVSSASGFFKKGAFTSGIYLPKRSNAISPSVLSVSTIEDGNDHLNTIVLRPSSSSGTTPQAAYNTAKANNSTNSVAVVDCNSTNGFACSITLQASQTIQYLVVSLPYREDRDVSFQIKKLDGNTKFTDLQVAVDSTGRASDYYRRVETRLNLFDATFPYPDYVIRASGDNGSNITKNFRVTNNCWYATNGATSTCDNAGTI